MRPNTFFFWEPSLSTRRGSFAQYFKVDSLRTDGSRDYDLSDEKDRPQRLVKKRSHHGAKMLTFIATTGKKKSKKKVICAEGA